MASWFRRPIELMERAHARFGDIFTLRFYGWGTFVFLCDPADIKTVFTGDPKVLHAGEGNLALRPVIGKHSVLVLDEAQHMRHRKLLLPPFHGERMHVFGKVMRDATDDQIDRWPVGRVFEAHDPMQKITLSVILRTVFGLDSRDEEAKLAPLLEAAMTAAVNPISLHPLFQRELRGLSPWEKLMEKKSRVDDALQKLITERRADPDAANKPDVLSLLLSARDEAGEPLTDEELRDELITVLVAGHETTATSLAWTLQLLLTHPQVLEAVQQELTDVVGDQPLDPDTLPQLTLLDAVIRESLRVRPIIPIVARRLKADFEVGGWTLPRGVTVAPCIWLAHRRPDIYPEPGAFRPERFVDHKPDPYAWLPFGGGVRRCIGQAFALYEMRVVLASILLRTRIHLAPGYAARVVRRSITFAPSEGTPVILDSCAPRRRTPRNVAVAPADTSVGAAV